MPLFRTLLPPTLALCLAASAASAQSVLERVLGQISTATQVSGIFANTADNLPTQTTLITERTETTSTEMPLDAADPGVRVFQVSGSAPGGFRIYWVTVGELGSTIPAARAGFYDDIVVAADGTVSMRNATDMVPGDTYQVRAVTGALIATITDTSGSATTISGDEFVFSDGTNAYLASLPVGTGAGWDPVLQEQTVTVPVATVVDLATTIDGSITNTASRIDTATASVADRVAAISGVTASFGNMSTTVLGAVNTGEIGLGTNQLVEEAISGASEAIRTTINQIGTQTGQTVLALNSALNTMTIDGSISNTFEGVNASVAAISPDQLDIISSGGILTLSGLDDLLGSMETTVLGAVNTGTIVSGVNNQVDGTVAGIVGNSATNMFAAAPAPTTTAPAPTE